MNIFWLVICTLIGTLLHAQGGSIEGRIYALENNKILPGTKLVLQKDKVYCQKTITDHQGNYNFVNLTAGNYSVWVIGEGYCQLEIEGVTLVDSQSIYLDLGMVAAAEGTTAETTSKIFKIYQGPVYLPTLVKDSLSYQNFRNECNVISEVYQGPQIKIAPPPLPTPPIQVERATHYNDTFKALEKKISPF